MSSDSAVNRDSRIITRNPWWAPRFIFGRIPAITARQLSLLSFVALALLFENYDTSLLGSTLKYIAIDLNIDETQLGTFNGWIRLGGLPVLFIVALADQIGRRRLFLFSVIVISLATFATAWSVNAQMFIIAQVICRTFLLTAVALSVVIVIEEFPAEFRGWGMGALAAIAGAGYGLGAILFAAIDYLPYGWRALYALGILPLFLLPKFAAGVKETQRFNAQQLTDISFTDILANWLQPLKQMAIRAPKRLGQLLALGISYNFGQGVVFIFTGYYLLSYLQWSPAAYSAMVFFGGILGIIGNTIAGRLADKYGRKPVGVIFLCTLPIMVFLFFRGPEILIIPAWILMVFSDQGARLITRTVSSELFPTAYRGSSTGVLTMSEALGAGMGLLVLSVFTVGKGDILIYIPWISCAIFIAAAVMLFFPETAGVELEEIERD